MIIHTVSNSTHYVFCPTLCVQWEGPAAEGCVDPGLANFFGNTFPKICSSMSDPHCLGSVESWSKLGPPSTHIGLRPLPIHSHQHIAWQKCTECPSLFLPQKSTFSDILNASLYRNVLNTFVLKDLWTQIPPRIVGSLNTYCRMWQTGKFGSGDYNLGCLLYNG